MIEPITDSTADTAAATDDTPPSRAGRRQKPPPRPRPTYCLNCETPALAAHDFCPACGQENRRHDVSLTEVFRDAWDEFAKIDSKLVKTMVPLLFRPGFLTREFIMGRRVRYISPFKMYLVVSFFFFTAVGWKAQAGITQSLARSQAKFAKQAEEAHTAAQRKSSPKTPSPPQTGLTPREKPLKIQVGEETMGLADLPASLDEYRLAQAQLPAAKRDSWGVQFAKLVMLRFKAGDADSLLGGLFDAASKMMFFLLPLYALLLKILYFRTRRLYVEHFVYALHLHTVLFLFLLTDLLIPVSGVGLVLTLAFAVYGFVSLRTVYGQGIGKTLLKGWLLLWAYSSILLFAFLITLLLSLAAQSGFLASLRSML